MNLKEYIQFLSELAKKTPRCDCCNIYFAQIVDWLKELDYYRTQEKNRKQWADILKFTKN